MSDISIVKTKEDEASKSLQVTVPVDRVRQAEDKALKYYRQRARLPGFRQGHAPEGVVRKRFGDAIRQTVLEEVIRESWEAAQTSEQLKPIAEPHIHNLKFETGGPIEFEFHVEVRPEVKLNRTSGFTLHRRVLPVTDAEVESRLRDVQEQKATWIPVEGQKPSPGQQVRIEVAPLEGENAGAAQPYVMVLGEGRAIPDVEERVMTLLPGETVDTEVRFPDDFSDESRRGQTRKVRIALHEVKRQELPALDDSFAREVGDFESLDALRAGIRSDLEREAEQTADQSVRQDLVRQLIEANGITAPSSLVDRLIQGYGQAYQIDQARLADFANEFRPMAESQVKRDLLLDTVVESEKLAATEAELDARVAAMAQARGLPVGQMYAQLEKANRLRELERGLTEEKAFAWLLQQSTIEESAS
ncbi:MAG TPA: trigger factor [Gemmatimonadales bacterium]|nr:trigger factor [Gemmatimonadales bacterium]